MIKYFLTITLFIVSVIARAEDIRGNLLHDEPFQMTAKNFFIYYYHQDEGNNMAAKFYLAGILDSGENKIWCSYKKMKPTSVYEFMNLRFKKNLDVRNSEKKASLVILSEFSKYFPCGSKK